MHKEYSLFISFRVYHFRVDSLSYIDDQIQWLDPLSGKNVLYKSILLLSRIISLNFGVKRALNRTRLARALR